jgi:asparagine synthase (glutamine-hydrolysing)
MCGLAGILDIKGQRTLDPQQLLRMNQALLHRGPDGGDMALRPGLGLGHRRLAIIDVAGGHQPMANEEGQVLIVFNGEIYNYQQHAAELLARGHRFGTRSDTEVLIHGYEEWGVEGLLGRLNGMFAFALWDAARERLVLARDRLGEKPLYYATSADGLLVFGSEIGAVLAGLGETPPLWPEAVADYFAYGYVPDPKTIFRGIHKLAPGHYLEIQRGRPLPAPQLQGCDP